MLRLDSSPFHPRPSGTPSPGGGVTRCAGNGKKQRPDKTGTSVKKNQTKEEALLWYNFLAKYSPRFHRQYVIGEYIVDFYCHQAKLVVELDGSGHYEPETTKKDQIRTKYLQSLGLRVLRFTNLDVLQKFSAVCEIIDNEIRNKYL